MLILIPSVVSESGNSSFREEISFGTFSGEHETLSFVVKDGGRLEISSDNELEDAASKKGVSLSRLKNLYSEGLGVYQEARFLNAMGGMVEHFLFKGTFK